MNTVLIVYHSMTDGTRQMASAAAAGAAEEEVKVVLLKATEAGAPDLLGAQGYLFATPENLASMSGLFKDFIDRTYYGVLEQLNGRPYASLICAGSDGRGAAQQLARIALGWRLQPIADPLIVCTHAQTPQAILAPKRIGAEELRRCAELGRTLAAGLAMGIF
jgi:multimeric flavodoxin WrbA